MDTVTYPHESVIAEVSRNFVPCKLESAKNVELARKFSARWLAGVVVADADERPAHVSIGFLPPADFIDELRFGRAIAAMGQKRYDDAHSIFATVGSRGGERAPEALFWWGISRYRQMKD